MKELPDHDEFLRIVAGHGMTILRNEGIHRHILFRKPDTNCGWFDLLTWPGALCISGDYGTYVFRRIEDMFEFFRGGLQINPAYWSEKVVAADRDGVKEFSLEKFRADALDHFDQSGYMDDEHDMRMQSRGQLQRELADVDDQHHAIELIWNFESECPGYKGFRFEDWEGSSEVFTYRFIFNCRAIVWAIQHFDSATALAAA